MIVVEWRAGSNSVRFSIHTLSKSSLWINIEFKRELLEIFTLLLIQFFFFIFFCNISMFDLYASKKNSIFYKIYTCLLVGK